MLKFDIKIFENFLDLAMSESALAQYVSPVTMIANIAFHNCYECGVLFRVQDMNKHLWKHARDKYDALPQRKKTGRFKQLRKFLSKQYPVG